MMELDNAFRCLLLLAGLFLSWEVATRPTTSVLRRGLLVAITLVSLWAYPRFGEWHQYGPYGRHTYHYHEIYHYYVGAKFAPELGNTRLYDCTWVAFQELRATGVATPEVPTIRDLRAPMTARPAAEVLASESPVCRSVFSAARWSAFKDDLRTLLDQGWMQPWWRVALFDLGFNPPPTWTVIGTPLARIIPLTPFTMELLPFIDLMLLFGVVPFLAYRTGGLALACAYLILLALNPIASWKWTGGSFFRQAEFFFLALATLALARERWARAGVAIGLATGLRIFPGAFAAGAALPLIRRFFERGRFAWSRLRDPNEPVLRYGLAAAATFGALGLLSLAFFGLDAWREFLHRIAEHNRTFFVMHIGYDKWASFHPGAANQDFWYEPGLERFIRWNQGLRAQLQMHQAWHLTAKLAATALAIYAAVRRATPAEGLFLVGSAFLYFWNIPANYYYLYLASWGMAILLAADRPYAGFRFATLFLLQIALAFCERVSNDNLIQNFWMNRAVLVALLAIYVSYLPLGGLASGAAKALSEDTSC